MERGLQVVQSPPPPVPGEPQQFKAVQYRPPPTSRQNYPNTPETLVDPTPTQQQEYRPKKARHLKYEEGDGLCPGCGGMNYSSRAHITIKTRDGKVIPIAPHCQECGYAGEEMGLELEGITGQRGAPTATTKQGASGSNWRPFSDQIEAYDKRDQMAIESGIGR